MTLISSQIGYDFDGVLCHTMPAFIQYWKDKYGWDIDCINTREFRMDFGPDYNFKHIVEDIETSINMFQPYLYPHTYAMELVREIGTRLNQVPIIITARSENNREVTEMWLNHWLAYPYELIMTGDTPKADVVAEQEGMLYFVEDRYSTCHSLAQLCDKVFMPRRPWNIGRDLLSEAIVPVNNLVEVYNDILGNSDTDSRDDSIPADNA